MICLQVRRFRCLVPDCPKKTFAEQVEGPDSRYARGTPAVTAVLEAIALALGGRAGARLAEWLAAAVSRTTQIRLVQAMPDPSVSASPRVLGGGRVRAAQGTPLWDTGCEPKCPLPSATPAKVQQCGLPRR